MNECPSFLWSGVRPHAEQRQGGGDGSAALQAGGVGRPEASGDRVTRRETLPVCVPAVRREGQAPSPSPLRGP